MVNTKITVIGTYGIGVDGVRFGESGSGNRIQTTKRTGKTTAAATAGKTRTAEESESTMVSKRVTVACTQVIVIAGNLIVTIGMGTIVITIDLGSNGNNDIVWTRYFAAATKG